MLPSVFLNYDLNFQRSSARGSVPSEDLGAVLEVVAENVPAGWGAPIYGKLDADLAAALMSINAVKGVEIGDGFASAELTGEETVVVAEAAAADTDAAGEAQA